MPFRQSPQEHSKSTQAMATAARDVAETAVFRAFKNGLFPTFGKPETVGNKPFLNAFGMAVFATFRAAVAIA